MRVMIKGQEELHRDTKSLAILNRNKNERVRKKRARSYLKSLEEKIIILESRINTLEEEMRNMKHG